MNPSAPDPSVMNNLILENVRRHAWKSRALATIGFTFGLIAIVLSIAIAWGNVVLVIPQLVHLLESYPHGPGQGGLNKLDWQHVQVSAALGKTSVLVATSVAFLALGTLVILLLVIFNRRVTLNQINASLSALSLQLKQLQDDRNSSKP